MSRPWTELVPVSGLIAPITTDSAADAQKGMPPMSITAEMIIAKAKKFDLCIAHLLINTAEA
jgi:hypothetical protein